MICIMSYLILLKKESLQNMAEKLKKEFSSSTIKYLDIDVFKEKFMAENCQESNCIFKLSNYENYLKNVKINKKNVIEILKDNGMFDYEEESPDVNDDGDLMSAVLFVVCSRVVYDFK